MYGVDFSAYFSYPHYATQPFGVKSKTSTPHYCDRYIRIASPRDNSSLGTDDTCKSLSAPVSTDFSNEVAGVDFNATHPLPTAPQRVTPRSWGLRNDQPVIVTTHSNQYPVYHASKYFFWS